MADPKFAQRFIVIKDAVDASLEDGRLSISEGLGIVKLVMEVGKEVLASIEDGSWREEVIESAEWAFDEYVVPYDLPIPDLYEPMIEKLVRSLIRPAIAGV